MTDLLAQFSGGPALDASVGSFTTLRDKRYRVLGEIDLLSVLPTDVVDNHNERGLEVHVSVCQDQTTLEAVDKDGKPVAEERYKYPEYLLRQYSVRKPEGEDSFLVFGFETINGTCP